MKERYILVNYNNEVSILDTQNEDLEKNETALLFSLDLCDEEGANYIEYELEQIVRILNEQNKIIKKYGK